MNVVTKAIIMVTAGKQDDVRRRVTRTILRLGVMVGVFLVVSAMFVTSAWALFSDTTSSATINRVAGDVVIVDDDSGSAMFNPFNMAPNDVVVKCIVVTYQGSLVPADMSFYGTSGGSLDAYLDLTIEEGSGGSFADCTGFSSSSTVFNNTLANFAATHTNFGSGITSWSSVASPESRTYRFTLTLQENNLAQGLSTTGTITWEAQNQ
ncbi:MAG: hypothetical protein V3S26_01875 [Acidimicrobiia bacterium]